MHLGGDVSENAVYLYVSVDLSAWRVGGVSGCFMCLIAWVYLCVSVIVCVCVCIIFPRAYIPLLTCL